MSCGAAEQWLRGRLRGLFIGSRTSTAARAACAALNWPTTSVFSRLPGLLKGLGSDGELHGLESRGNYTSSGGTQTGGEIAGFMPETMNLGLSYAYRSWNYDSK